MENRRFVELIYFFYGHVNSKDIEQGKSFNSLGAFFALILIYLLVLTLWVSGLRMSINTAIYILFGISVVVYFFILSYLSNFNQLLIDKIEVKQTSKSSGVVRLVALTVLCTVLGGVLLVLVPKLLVE